MWLKAENLKGQKILDEVRIGSTLYVEVVDNKDKESKEKQFVGETTKIKNQGAWK